MQLSLQILKDSFKSTFPAWTMNMRQWGAKSLNTLAFGAVVFPIIQKYIGGSIPNVVLELNKIFGELGIVLISHWVVQFISNSSGKGNVNERDLVTAVQNEVEQNKELRAEFEKLIELLEGKRILHEEFRKMYLNRNIEQCKQLSLAGIDRHEVDAEVSHLDLDAVYTALLTLTPEEHEEVQQNRAPGRESSRQSVLEQMNRHPRLVILGDPGSGKSTFINFVTLCFAGQILGQKSINLELLTAPLSMEDREEKKRQPWGHDTLLPVRIILRDFAARGLPAVGEKATVQHLWQFIESELDSATLKEYTECMRKELIETGGLVLFDGLDEVPEADRRRAQIKQVVEDFAITYPNCHIVVTSRPYAYQKQDWRLRGFPVTILAPFNKNQISHFIDRWYTHYAAVRDKDRKRFLSLAEQLKHDIFHSDRLFSMAERPLLLTLMASLNAWSESSLPRKREELYAVAVDILLYQWEKRRMGINDVGKKIVIQKSLSELLQIERDDVLNLLTKLAFEAHSRSQPESDGTSDIHERDLVYALYGLNRGGGVTERMLVDYLSQRSGILVPRGNEVYAFPHRTFQEYLAACYIVNDDNFSESLAKLVREDPNRWREVALLACAQSNPQLCWAFAEESCQCEPETIHQNMQDVWATHIAAHALTESVNIERISEANRRKLTRIKRCIGQIIGLKEFPARERALAGVNLARLGDERKEVMTGDGIQFCLVPCGDFWMGEDNEKHRSSAVSYDFWMSRYPITQSQFKEFVDNGGYRNEQYWKEAKESGIWKEGRVKGRYESEWRDVPHRFPEPFGLSNHPVVGATWFEALAFIRWLNDFWAGRLPANYLAQLPSEVEWEKAARGGMEIPSRPVVVSITEISTSENCRKKPNPSPERIYPWGNNPDPNCANYDETNINTTSAVGCFPLGASPYGCEEMSGNVWEWTRSLDKNYPYKPHDGREATNASINMPRVLRGGAFYYNLRVVRCASRHWLIPDRRYDHVGFRVVVSPFFSER